MSLEIVSSGEAAPPAFFGGGRPRKDILLLRCRAAEMSILTSSDFVHAEHIAEKVEHCELVLSQLDHTVSCMRELMLRTYCAVCIQLTHRTTY